MSKNHLHTIAKALLSLQAKAPQIVFDLISDAGLRAIERAVHDRALKGLDTADEILELTNLVSACRAELQHRAAADDALLRELGL